MSGKDDAARLREMAGTLDQMAKYCLPPCDNYGLILRSIADRLEAAPAVRVPEDVLAAAHFWRNNTDGIGRMAHFIRSLAKKDY